MDRDNIARLDLAEKLGVIIGKIREWNGLSGEKGHTVGGDS